MTTLLKRCGIALPALLVLAVVAGLSTGCKKEVPPPPPPPPTPTPVPPAGNVVFVQGGHLMRIGLKGMEIVPLTGGSSTEWFPALSPLGDEVLYWSNSAEKGEEPIYNLWKIRIDGTGRTQLTNNETNAINHASQNLLMNNSPAWSTDGKRIVYSLDGDIWTMSPDGFNPETVLLGYGAFCPFFSPDGKNVLFIARREDPVYNIWSINLQDHSVRKVTQYVDWNVGSPSFSPNGQKILYNLYKETITQVYVCNADGSSPINLTSDGKSLMPRWAEDGRKILYCAPKPDDQSLNVFMANPNGTDPKPVTNSQGTSPSWGPQFLVVPVPTPVTK